MKRRASLALSALLLAPLLGPADASAQQVVKVDVLQLYGDVPKPPTSVQEAHARAACERERSCTVAAFYDPFEEKLGKLNQQLQMAVAGFSQPATHPLANVDPAELRARIASMTQAEQIAFAKELSGMTATALVPEPPLIQAALDEVWEVREAIGDEGIAIVEGRYKGFHEEALLEEVRRKRAEIEGWEVAEKAKLVEPSPSASAGAHQAHNAAWYRIRDEAMERQIAAEHAYQQALQDQWVRELNRLRDRFAPFQGKLAAADYGEAAQNKRTKEDFTGMQTAMLSALGPLLEASRRATQSGADLWQKKLDQDAHR
ncbi:MAG TPA: hypothetical protein VMK65_05445 [Longimicrobiales bacterium]|nr:hypothetical protein [Longimicrobiales bacterium]